MAGHRPGALRHVDGAVAYRTNFGNTGAAAVGGGFGDRGYPGGVGRACCLLSPVTLWDRRVHRLFAVRGGCPGSRSAVRHGGPGGSRPEAVQRTVAGQAAQSTAIPDLSV